MRRRVVSMLSVEEAMTKEVVTFAPETPVKTVIDQMLEKKIGSVVIVAGGKPAGIFSERDVLKSLSKGTENILSQPVSAVMTANPVTIETTAAFTRAMEMMDTRSIRHLPVVDAAGKIVGILSIKDMLRSQVNFIRGKTKPAAPAPAPSPAPSGGWND
ncbi:CBS domain-containing protein [bacterium]|nr:CBS domain-containing protein [bacterium]